MLFALTSKNSIVSVVAAQAGVVLGRLDGTSIAATPGVNFTGPTTPGQYAVVVTATDNKGCTAVTQPRTITVP